MQRGKNAAVAIRYLSLALFARRIIDALIEYVGGKAEELERLDEAVESLKSLQSEGRPMVKAVKYYEQVKVLQGVFGESVRKEMIDLLEEVRSTPPTQASKSKAKLVMKLFFELEKQALTNFERPPAESIPRGIVKLCQAT